jgi:hypothetical protein
MLSGFCPTALPRAAFKAASPRSGLRRVPEAEAEAGTEAGVSRRRAPRPGPLQSGRIADTGTETSSSRSIMAFTK